MAFNFNDLPAAVQEILQRLSQLSDKVDQISVPRQIASSWLSLEELLSYLPTKPAKQTVYAWVSNGKIPCHKQGKKLAFLRKDIDNWLLSSQNNLDTKPATFLAKRQKRGGASV